MNTLVKLTEHDDKMERQKQRVTLPPALNRKGRSKRRTEGCSSALEASDFVPHLKVSRTEAVKK